MTNIKIKYLMILSLINIISSNAQSNSDLNTQRDYISELSSIKEPTLENNYENKKTCSTNRKKWLQSSIDRYSYSKEAVIILLNNKKYIKIWISLLEDENNCTFKKNYITIDCLNHNTLGYNQVRQSYFINPIDPDSIEYDLITDICKSYNKKKIHAIIGE